jgi:predicted SPOUT superfamily RNA methylase MTH1
LDEDLQFVGILSPVDAPHHVRVNDRCKYREGIVLDKIGPTGGSCVNVGIGEKSKTVELMDQLVLTPGVRCTVQMTDFNSLEAYPEPNHETRGGKTHPRKQYIPVKVVSPRAPTLDDGTYWGYSVRIADSLQQAIDSCPFEGENYDLKVGTSERGDTSLSMLVQNSKKGKKFPNFKHMIVVFGGISGIEEVSICTPFSCLFITSLQ